MYLEVKALNQPLRDALASVRYGRADIQVIATESVESGSSASDGSRGFACAVNLETGERKTITGDWGGSGLGRAILDQAGQTMAIPPNGAVIKGSMGYPRTYATIYAHPHAVGAFLLPSGEAEETLSDAEQQAIYCFAAIKGGEYRRDEMRRRNVTPETVDSLVERGYLKRSRNGATQITTKGRNARTVKY